MTPDQFVAKLKAMVALRERLPRIIGEDARSFFLDNYRKGGFEDTNFVPWVKRKVKRRYLTNPDNLKVAGEGKFSKLTLSAAGKNDKGRALLVRSGRLRRSIQIMSSGPGYVVIGTDVPYASFHNDGVEGRLPQRKFLGESTALNRLIEKRVIEEAMKVLL